MAERIVTECDYCGREDVVGCIGGTHYYCSRHEDEVAQMHADDDETNDGYEPDYPLV